MKRIALTLTLVFAFLLLVLTGFALSPIAGSEAPRVEWSKTYGGYSGNDVIQTSDGGFAIVGQNATYRSEDRGFVGFNVTLLKTGSSGEVEWSKSYDYKFGGSSIYQTNDGGFVICGGRGLLKIDSVGNIQWSKIVEPIDNSIAIQTSDGGYLLVGYKGDGSAALIVKTDENGNVSWNTTFLGSRSLTTARAVVEDKNGEYSVAGTWNGHFWFAKLDSKGEFIWNQTYYFGSFGVSPYEFRSIVKIGDEGFLLAGGDGRNGWLVKTDSEGNEQWNNHYLAGPRDSFFASVVQTDDKGYFATGTQDFGYAWLVRTGASGNLLWNATFGKEFSGLNTASSIIKTNDEDYLVGGTLNQNIWLIKLNPESGISEGLNLAAWIVAIVIIVVTVVLASAGLLVYWKKRKP